MTIRLHFKIQNFLFLVPPHLKGDGMHDITLKKGRPIRYDLWFGGEPAPSVEWIRDGRTLMSYQFTSIELYCKNTIYTERNTVLSIPKVYSRAGVFNFLFTGPLKVNKCPWAPKVSLGSGYHWQTSKFL